MEAALAELGLASADKAEIEVLQQPERGFLGLGGREAIVRVRAKKEDASARKRRSRKPLAAAAATARKAGRANQPSRPRSRRPARNPAPAGRNSSGRQTGAASATPIPSREATPQNLPSKNRQR